MARIILEKAFFFLTWQELHVVIVCGRFRYVPRDGSDDRGRSRLASFLLKLLNYPSTSVVFRGRCPSHTGVIENCLRGEGIVANVQYFENGEEKKKLVVGEIFQCACSDVFPMCVRLTSRDTYCTGRGSVCLY